MLKTEMKKAAGSLWFIATLIVAVAVALYSAVFVINQYYDTIGYDVMSESMLGDITNPDHAMITLFNSWIGQEWVSSGQALFYLLLPFLSTLAYSWSLASEMKSGYVKHIVTRARRKQYYVSKYFSAFFSGGLVIVIPMILNLMTVSAFIPAIKPDVFYDIYYGMNTTQAFSALFFEHPFIFIIYRLASNFIFAGLFAAFGVSLAFFIKNKFVLVTIPFLLSLVLSYISSYHFLPFVFSPVQFLHGGGDAYVTSVWVMIAEALILFAVSFCVTMFRGEKDDVF